MIEPKRPQGRPKKGYRQLSIKLPPNIWQLTSTTAKTLNITQAALWEKALTEFLKTHKLNTQ